MDFRECRKRAICTDCSGTCDFDRQPCKNDDINVGKWKSLKLTIRRMHDIMHIDLYDRSFYYGLENVYYLNF